MLVYRTLQAGALAIAALCAMPLHADVTLRYKTEVKLNPTLPPQLAQQAMTGMQAMLQPETVTQFREGKGYSSFSGYRCLIDFAKQEMTFLDADKQRYATAPAAQLADEMKKAMPEMPAQARAAMAAMKSTVESSMTGRTETIQGIEAEEREVVLTMSAPALPNMPAGPMTKLVIHFWTAKAAEAMRVPAIREVTGYNLWSYATMNPAASLEKLFKDMPGGAEGMGRVMTEMQAGKSVLLRSQVQMFMPAMAAMMKQMPADKSPFGPGFDVEAPFMEMNQELTEISSAPIAATVFEVPEGYQRAPAGDIIRDMMAKSQAAFKK